MTRINCNCFLVLKSLLDWRNTDRFKAICSTFGFSSLTATFFRNQNVMCAQKLDATHQQSLYQEPPLRQVTVVQQHISPHNLKKVPNQCSYIFISCRERNSRDHGPTRLSFHEDTKEQPSGENIFASRSWPVEIQRYTCNILISAAINFERHILHGETSWARLSWCIREQRIHIVLFNILLNRGDAENRTNRRVSAIDRPTYWFT